MSTEKSSVVSSVTTLKEISGRSYCFNFWSVLGAAMIIGGLILTISGYSDYTRYSSLAKYGLDDKIEGFYKMCGGGSLSLTGVFTLALGYIIGLLKKLSDISMYKLDEPFTASEKLTVPSPAETSDAAEAYQEKSC
jgi:hypothetical protein